MALATPRQLARTALAPAAIASEARVPPGKVCSPAPKDIVFTRLYEDAVQIEERRLQKCQAALLQSKEQAEDIRSSPGKSTSSVGEVDKTFATLYEDAQQKQARREKAAARQNQAWKQDWGVPQLVARHSPDAGGGSDGEQQKPRWRRLHELGQRRQEEIEEQRQLAIARERQLLQGGSAERRDFSADAGESRKRRSAACRRLYADSLRRQWQKETARADEDEREQRSLQEVSVHRIRSKKADIDGIVNRLHGAAYQRELSRQNQHRLQDEMVKQMASSASSFCHSPCSPGLCDSPSPTRARFHMLFDDAERRDEDRRVRQELLVQQEVGSLKSCSVHKNANKGPRRSEDIQRIFERVADSRSLTDRRIARLAMSGYLDEHTISGSRCSSPAAGRSSSRPSSPSCGMATPSPLQCSFMESVPSEANSIDDKFAFAADTKTPAQYRWRKALNDTLNKGDLDNSPSCGERQIRSRPRASLHSRGGGDRSPPPLFVMSGGSSTDDFEDGSRSRGRQRSQAWSGHRARAEARCRNEEVDYPFIAFAHSKSMQRTKAVTGNVDVVRVRNRPDTSVTSTSASEDARSPSESRFDSAYCSHSRPHVETKWRGTASSPIQRMPRTRIMDVPELLRFCIKMATKIQTAWRAKLARRKKLNRIVARVQAAFRGHRVRTALKERHKQRAAARERQQLEVRMMAEADRQAMGSRRSAQIAAVRDAAARVIQEQVDRPANEIAQSCSTCGVNFFEDCRFCRHCGTRRSHEELHEGLPCRPEDVATSAIMREVFGFAHSCPVLYPCGQPGLEILSPKPPGVTPKHGRTKSPGGHGRKQLRSPRGSVRPAKGSPTTRLHSVPTLKGSPATAVLSGRPAGRGPAGRTKITSAPTAATRTPTAAGRGQVRGASGRAQTSRGLPGPGRVGGIRHV
eukprot:TRINITY_DN42834_c0_g1_i1.p1 TRINITY_DN42834_c0_g1~~TRINITY_DN42834_c0_g1_i1.p1  ORF type:complete len:917 (+),score=146.16 TRINITY_DN42834_c0_g1_i1:58-2808(+)